MNSKNMKKSLNAKLNDWISHVDDAEIRDIIQRNTIITGGALVSLLTGDDVKDYDVYFKTKDALMKVTEYYLNKFLDTHKDFDKRDCFIKFNEDTGRVEVFIRSSGALSDEDGNTVTDESEPDIKTSENYEEEPKKQKYRPVYITSNAITLSDKIQIVVRFYGDVDEIHKNYDFTHCTCSWCSWDNRISLPQKALECIINKELFYQGSKYPLCSIIRTRKFLSRGWIINAGQYLKMCLQLNEFDLLDVNVLQDQLTGVDSAYFSMLINAVREKQNSDEDFKLSNSYIIEIVNRLF